MSTSAYSSRKLVGFFLGVGLFITMLVLPHPAGLSSRGWRTAAVATLMGIIWITEAIPISVTALLPIALFPILNIVSVKQATAPYANPLIFLFMGGFVIAIAMQRWDLHRRIAINIISFVGVKPSSIIIGFIISSAFLSMWVSNTATALMMLPIGLSVLELLDQKKTSKEKLNFEIVLVLCIAYACNIGGMGTLIGTPPNALLAGFVSENYNITIDFANWMLVGIPIVLVSLPLMYFLLTKLIYPIRLNELPGGQALIDEQLSELGNITGPEKKVAAVFLLTALFWVTRPLLTTFIPGLSDAGIAICAAIILFLLPVDHADRNFLLQWSDTKELPWGILILFGGGLSLASAISATGLSKWIGQSLSALHTWPIFILVALILSIIIFLTELTSNTATTAAFLPIMASVAVGLGKNPLLLAVPAALGASCAFMLPVATPPNAIIYGSDKISILEMSKAGLWLNFIFIFLLTGFTFSLISWVFGI